MEGYIFKELSIFLYSSSCEANTPASVLLKLCYTHKKGKGRRGQVRVTCTCNAMVPSGINL